MSSPRPTQLSSSYAATASRLSSTSTPVPATRFALPVRRGSARLRSSVRGDPDRRSSVVRGGGPRCNSAGALGYPHGLAAYQPRQYASRSSFVGDEHVDAELGRGRHGAARGGSTRSRRRVGERERRSCPSPAAAGACDAANATRPCGNGRRRRMDGPSTYSTRSGGSPSICSSGSRSTGRGGTTLTDISAPSAYAHSRCLPPGVGGEASVVELHQGRCQPVIPLEESVTGDLPEPPVL